MSKCEYCYQFHAQGEHCPENRRDKMHSSVDVDVNKEYYQSNYSERLKDGFTWMYTDENIIIDKFNIPHGSGG